MFTRSITCVYLDGKGKVAQYGCEDGYPSWHGLIALRFLKHEIDEAHFIQRVRHTEYLPTETWDAIHRDFKQVAVNHVNEAEEEIILSGFSGFSRYVGPHVLYAIEASDQRGLLLQDWRKTYPWNAFSWGYVVDLDERVFEVYERSNKDFLVPSDRFYREQQELAEPFPLRRIACFSFDALPEPKEFLDTLANIVNSKAL